MPTFGREIARPPQLSSQRLTILSASETVGEPFAGGTGFRQCDRDAGFLTGMNLFAVVVAAISNDLERLDSHLGRSAGRASW